jgi:DNA helicase-2/ATP-dependent DNA helicase PcrA
MAAMSSASHASAESVLDGLDPEQRQAALAVRGPVCILAGAGTGKTRAITHRIAYAVRSGAVPASQVLAVTFTARAAGEMRGRLRGLGVPDVQARTFHAAALAQLTYFWPKVMGTGLPRILERKVSVLATAAGRLRFSLSPAELRDVAGEIEWMKALQRPPQDYQTSVALAGRSAPLPPPDITKIYTAYEDLKREQNLVDFEDLLLHTIGLLETEPLVAREVRERYRYFVVDEYQDVNPLQHRLLDGWLGERDDLCVVGDPEQTIYSFTGATSDYLREFGTRYPEAAVVRLVRNYRSTAQVLHLANRLAAGGGQLIAQRPDGPTPRLDVYEDEPAEAAAVAAAVRRLMDEGVPASEIAVLYRVNAQSQTYEQAFAEAGLPYVMRGGERFFDRPEIRQAVMLLRGAARASAPNDELAKSVRDVLAAAGLTPQPPSGSGAARERWESLASLVRLAEDLAATNAAAGLAELVQDLDVRASMQHAPTVEGVTLASLHAAKGLEWDAVFLVGLVDGTVPIIYATTPDQIAEERRLLYVGVTRARVHLRLSWSKSRSPGGRGSRQPCPFLADLPLGASSGTETRARRVNGEPRRPQAPMRCRICDAPLTKGVDRKLGRCASHPSTMDEQLFERLRAWRLDRAKELKQPAFCVFTDATLTRIAEIRPTSHAELTLIPGVGAAKLRTFGDEVLELCTSVDTPVEK